MVEETGVPGENHWYVIRVDTMGLGVYAFKLKCTGARIIHGPVNGLAATLSLHNIH
jgi:hypothetical protein